MSESTDYVEEQDEESDPFLTPKAAAIAGFTLAVFSMMGQGTWTFALQSLTELIVGTDSFRAVAIMVGVAALLLAAGALLLARVALVERSGSWDEHLARATVVVGGLGAVLAIITIVAGVLSEH